MPGPRPRLPALLLLCLCGVAAAQAPRVFGLVAEGRNLFRVADRDVFVETHGCNPPDAAPAPQLLFAENGPSHVVWPEQGMSCKAQNIMGPVELPRQRFNVNVSRQARGWYEVFGLNTYLHVPLCLRMSVGEEAVLNVLAPDDMRLLFRDGQVCTVARVYSRLKP